jgi:hypothetical protein
MAVKIYPIYCSSLSSLIDFNRYVYLQNVFHQTSFVVLLCQYDLSKFHAAIKILREEPLNNVFMLKPDTKCSV